MEVFHCFIQTQSAESTPCTSAKISLGDVIFYEKIIFFSLWVFLLYFWSLMIFRAVRKWYLGPKFLKIGLLIIFGILGAWNFLVWSASRRIGSLSDGKLPLRVPQWNFVCLKRWKASSSCTPPKFRLFETIESFPAGYPNEISFVWKDGKLPLRVP